MADVARATNETEFFVFLIALGGWDVTLWATTRATKVRGILHPASTENTDTSQLETLGRRTDTDGAFKTFELVRPLGSSHAFGPGIGDLVTWPTASRSSTAWR